MLDPGTAINVTLYGNYTELEAPYMAILKAYYDDNSDPVSRPLSAIVRTNEKGYDKYRKNTLLICFSRIFSTKKTVG